MVGVGAREVEGSHGIRVTADLEERDASLEGLEMAVLPGGMPGTLNLEKSPVVRACVEHCARHSRVAAICAAPSVLGHWGLLQGRHAVCFPGFEQELKGALPASGLVCVDGNITTGKGPGAALPFALTLVEELCGPEKAKKIRASLQCQ